MPCRDGGPSSDQVMVERLEKIQKNNQDKINLLTSMLCSACGALEKYDFDFSLNPRLDEWWTEHQEKDRKRKEKAVAARLKREEAMEIAKKSFQELTADDKLKLKAAGLL